MKTMEKVYSILNPSEEEYGAPSPTSEQLGLPTLDGTGSMKGADKSDPSKTKAEAVAEAVKGLLERLYVSSRRNEIHMAVIAYDSNDPGEVRAERFSVTSEEMVQKPADFWNPLRGHGGSTPIGAALAKAGEMAKEFLDHEGELPREVVIVLMSDGLHNYGRDHGLPEPEPVAEQLKADPRITIATVAYGGDADVERLKRLASDEERYFTEVDDPDSLRDFFVWSILQPAR